MTAAPIFQKQCSDMLFYPVRIAKWIEIDDSLSHELTTRMGNFLNARWVEPIMDCKDCPFGQKLHELVDNVVTDINGILKYKSGFIRLNPLISFLSPYADVPFTGDPKKVHNVAIPILCTIL